MLLYLPLLISKLCYCESLTSLEIFDVFDPIIDLELPSATGSNVKKSVNASNVGNDTVMDSNTTDNTFNSSTFDGNITTSMDKENYDKLIFNTNRFFYNGEDMKKQFMDTIENSSKSDIKMQHNNTNELSMSENGDINGVLYENKLNHSSHIATNGSFYNKSATLPVFNIPPATFVCPEEEAPANIGAYEVPTQMDVVIHIRNHLMSMYQGFHTKAMNFLKDIQESATLPVFNIPPATFVCPEEEAPANIGAYEVPTQMDVVIHIRNHLMSMYQGFHTKAMNFLKDIQEATQASWSRKMFCRGPTELMLYRRCVRWVGDLSVLTTKSLVTALETARHNITTFMQGKICSISALSVDPIHLIRILAAEKVSLEFALPDFLRQLDACARHCPRTRFTLPREYLKTTHLTDKDFVIRHYLTQQNYNQQLKKQYKN